MEHVSLKRLTSAEKPMDSLSIIIPVYNEEGSIKELAGRISAVCKGFDFEILFVDDGSTDTSLKIIKELAENPHIKYISFRKNLGKAAALQAGFKNSRGAIILTMDADLQDDPCEISRFIEKINEGYDVVSGWKKKRLDPLEKRLPSKLFNATVSLLSGVKLHDFNCGFKAYRREVVDSISLYGELHRFIPVLAARKGFSITEIVVQHHKREHGKSKYGARRYLRGLFDAITVSFLGKYRDKPLHFFGLSGLLLLLAGGGICLYLTILSVFLGQKVGGRPLLLMGVLFIIMGMQFFSIGLIGDMILDVNNRSLYNESHVKEKSAALVT